MKLGLVFGGGGARGLAHIGVLKVFEREKIPITCIAGSSIGALIGGTYAVLNDAKAVEAFVYNFIERPCFQKLDMNEFAAFEDKTSQNGWGNLITKMKISLSFLKTFTNSAIFGEEITEEIFAPFADFDDPPIELLRIKFSAVATDLLSGKEIVIKNGSLKKALMASSAIPGFFPPVERENQLLIDGSASDSVPVHVVKEQGADYVIAVDVTKDLQNVGPLTNALHILYRMDEIITFYLTRERLANADLIIRPAVRNVSWANFDQIRELIREGEQAAEKMLPEIDRMLKPKGFLPFFKKFFYHKFLKE